MTPEQYNTLRQCITEGRARLTRYGATFALETGLDENTTYYKVEYTSIFPHGVYWHIGDGQGGAQWSKLDPLDDLYSLAILHTHKLNHAALKEVHNP